MSCCNSKDTGSKRMQCPGPSPCFQPYPFPPGRSGKPCLRLLSIPQPRATWTLMPENIPCSLPRTGLESATAQGHAEVGHGLGGFETELPSACQCLDASVISMRPPGSAMQRAAKAIKNTSALYCAFEMRYSLSFQLFIHPSVLTV